MNAAKAKRRWLRWCRYVAATGTKAGPYGGYHSGHAKAYDNHMFAGRYAPIGARVPYYPRWSWGRD